MSETNFNPEPNDIRHESSEEEASLPQKVYVEVGSGLAPVPLLWPNKIRENDIYLGVDADQRALEFGRKRMRTENNLDNRKRNKPKNHSNLYFMAAEAEHLPLQDESVDEIFFGNIFGLLQFSQYAKILPILAEAYRVLKKDGTLVVNENNTPIDSFDMSGLLEQAKFRVETLHNVNEMNDKYGQDRPNFITSLSMKSYLLIAKKS